MKYGCSLKSSPAASNLLNQLWGCFPANFCLDTSTSLATAWPEAIYVHLMLTGAAGLSCWWNTVILFLITVCSMWDSAGLRETIRDLRVCVHSVANKENRPAPWKKNTCSIPRTEIWAHKWRISSSSHSRCHQIWCQQKRNCSDMFKAPELACVIFVELPKHKSQASPVTLFVHALELQGGRVLQIHSAKQNVPYWMDLYFGPNSNDR